MQIIEHETNRLVLQERSLIEGVLLGVGALLWIAAAAGVAVQGALRLSVTLPPPTFYWVRMFGLLVVFSMGCFFAIVGGIVAWNVFRGVSCAFDRNTQEVTIRRPRGFKTAHQTYSIYGVSHAHMEGNKDLQIYVIYLVLRSGKRIQVGRANLYEKDQAEAVVRVIRAFLQGH